MQNVLNVWVFEDNLIEKLVFGRSRLNSSVVEKLFISYSCILFKKKKKSALRSFCISLLCFSKFHFSRFSIDRSCFSTDRNCNKNFLFEFAWLDWHSIDAWLIETKKFQFLSIWPIFFFLHHLCLGFTCIALFSVSILQFCSHISHCFHITCIHFATLGTQLDQKLID